MNEIPATGNRLHVARTVQEARQFVLAAKASGKRVGLVPTMGALHKGHLSLVERCRSECDCTIASIFVNPIQFGPNEDYKKYPRPLEEDLALLAAANVDLVFAPSVDEMYPAGFATQVEVGGISQLWEGAIRPGHFRGVATVVLKLFEIIPADCAYFGRKDYQQSLVVKRMVADLNLPQAIVVCPLVRNADGLALSSRNAYLSAEERCQALVISRSLTHAKATFQAGERNAERIRELLRQEITSTPSVQLEYAAVVDPNTLIEISQIEQSAIALVAARVGKTRLIDNEVLGFEP